MNANLVNASDQRLPLKDIVPLDTPLSIRLGPIIACNFKCRYCLYGSNPSALEQTYGQDRVMNMDTYHKAIDQMVQFPQKIKSLILCGIGEPLLHPQIADMVAYAKDAGVAHKTEIISNGSLLTHDMSDQLIAAGLDSLRISIQGLSSEKYRQISEVEMNMERFVEQIRYFFTHRTNTKLYVKIMDAQLDSESDRQRFFNMFGDFCDTIGIEHLVPMVNDIDYGTMKTVFSQSKYGSLVNTHVSVCPFPFYTMDIVPSGEVYPCCIETDTPVKPINLHQKSLQSIWNEDQHRFQLLQLKRTKQGIPKCNKCPCGIYSIQAEDILDAHTGEILERYARQEKGSEPR